MYRYGGRLLPFQTQPLAAGRRYTFCAVNHHIALLQNHTIGARHFGRHNLDFIQNLACLAAHTEFFLSATVVLKLTTLDRLWICDKHYIVNAQSIN